MDEHHLKEYRLVTDIDSTTVNITIKGFPKTDFTLITFRNGRNQLHYISYDHLK